MRKIFCKLFQSKKLREIKNIYKTNIIFYSQRVKPGRKSFGEVFQSKKLKGIKIEKKKMFYSEQEK